MTWASGGLTTFDVQVVLHVRFSAAGDGQS